MLISKLASLLLANSAFAVAGLVSINNQRYVIDRDASANTNGLVSYDDVGVDLTTSIQLYSQD